MSAREARRGDELRRQLQLVELLLRGETITRSRVASVLGVQLAAADRRLRVLREWPLARQVGRGGVALAAPPLLRGAPRMAAVIAACLSNGLAALFRGTAYERGMHEALDFVVAAHPRRAEFKELRRKFLFVPKGGDPSLPEGDERLDEVIDAVLRSRRVRIRYRHFDGEPASLQVEPLSIVVYEHQLYVFARTRDGKLHPYRFSRIEEITGPAGTFVYPPKAEYDPEQVLDRSFGIYLGDGPVEEVRLRLSSAWKTYVQTHRWHHTQRVRPLGADFLELTISVPITPEVESWVLGFRDQAEVLSPPSLRNRIAQCVSALQATYATDSGRTSREGTLRRRR